MLNVGYDATEHNKKATHHNAAGLSSPPESEELGTSVRHLIVDRYRILFIVERKTVTILHVLGMLRSLHEAAKH
jgi:hypothetical protein